MEDKKIIEISTGTIVKVFVILGLIGVAILLKDILSLILIAFIFSTALSPFVEKIEKRGLPRTAAVTIVYIISGFLVFLLFRAIVPTVIEQVNTIAGNQESYIESINRLLERVPESIKENTNQYLSDISGRVKEVSLSGLLSGVLGFFSGLIGLITILVLMFYVLLDKDGVEKVLVKYMPDNYKRRGFRVFKKIKKNMSAWLRGQIFLSFIVGLVTYIGLLIIGADFALSLAVFAAFMELIPYIGPVISGSAAVIITFVDSPIKALYVIILFVLVQLAENNFLVPQVMKKSVGLSPVFTIISLIIGAKLFGILGAILAIPVAAALSVVVEEIHEYERIEEEERLEREKKKKSAGGETGRNK